jgi:hypothetical protein
MREAEQSGNFRFNEDGSATLRGVPASIPAQLQSTSPLVAAAIKPPVLEPPPPKPRTPSPIETKPPPVTKPVEKYESDEEDSEDESEEEEVL